LETITISLEKYKCLRKHLELANEIFESLGAVGGENAPKAAPRQTKKDVMDKYRKLIESGERVKKPLALKNKKHG
jgi:hypothetical protein